MRKSIPILTLLAFGAGCQPSAKPRAKQVAPGPQVTPATIVVGFLPPPYSGQEGQGRVTTVAHQPASEELPPIPVLHGMVLRPDIRSQPVADSSKIKHFFGAYNLASLIQTVQGGQYGYAMNGFRGTGRYRTEVVITSARQRPQNPRAYVVRGLSRTKRRIRAFSGEILFDSLATEPMLTAQDEADIDAWAMLHVVRLDHDKTSSRYAVAGRVQLSENPAMSSAAAFRGRVVMELELSKKGRLTINTPFLHGPSQGGSVKYAGNWTTAQPSRVTPTVWVRNVIGYGPFIHSDFVIGERDVAINPKYAKQGWNTVWENDEWWARSPKPSL